MLQAGWQMAHSNLRSVPLPPAATPAHQMISSQTGPAARTMADAFSEAGSRRNTARAFRPSCYLANDQPAGACRQPAHRPFSPPLDARGLGWALWQRQRQRQRQPSTVS